MDKEKARRNVIGQQVRAWGGLDPLSNAALAKVPREAFVPLDHFNFAFADTEIALNAESRMFAPKIEGRILSALCLRPGEEVLEIGTGSGYTAALFATLASRVVSLDIDATLLARASENLRAQGIENVELRHGDFREVLKFEERFDAVVIGASVPELDKDFLDLLKVGGRLFVVEGNAPVMHAKLIRCTAENCYETKVLFETKLEVMKGCEVVKHFEF